MIESGQIERQPDVLQYLTTTTDAGGKFKFQQVRAGIPYQIVYWGGGAAPSRHSLFTPMSAAELSAVTIEAARPAKLIVKIDRTTYPDAHQLTLNGSESGSGYRSSELAANDPTVAFDGLAAGKYYLNLSGPYLRLDGNLLTSSWSSSQGVILVEGDEQSATFGGAAANRTLIGQLGAELNIDFPREKQHVNISLRPELPEPVPPPFPGDAEQDGGVAARLWMQNWLKSDAGRDWQHRRAAFEELRSLAPSFTAHPDDEGRFEFRDVPPGNYRAQIYVKNGRPATLPLIKVEPRADAAAAAVQDLGVMNPTVR